MREETKAALDFLKALEAVEVKEHGSKAFVYYEGENIGVLDTEDSTLLIKDCLFIDFKSGESKTLSLPKQEDLSFWMYFLELVEAELLKYEDLDDHDS